MSNSDLDKVLMALGESTQKAIDWYSSWFVINSVVMILVGIIVILAAYRFRFKFEDVDEANYAVIIRLGIGFLGLMFVAANIADLLNPEAAALHQLIRDLN